MGAIEDTEALLRELHFARDIRHALTHVRLIHESDMDTFKRLLRLGAERMCKPCRGYGRTLSGDSCTACAGTGALPMILPPGA